MKAEKKAIERQGPCMFCGGPYAAHRRIDGQMERVIAGDPIEDVADDYDMTVAEMVTEWDALMTLYADVADEVHIAEVTA